MKFTYEARDAANRVRKGVTEAPSLREATKLLIDQGWYVSKIKPRRRLSRGVLSFGGGFVPPIDVALFVRHLGTMLKSGISLAEALEAIVEQTTRQRFRRIVSALLARVKSGRTLSSALEAHPRVFDPLIVNMVKVGEASGTLEANLQYLAGELEDRIELRQKVRAASLYPFIVLLTTAGLGLMLAYFVLPKLARLFRTLNVELPLATRILMAVATAIERYGTVMLIGGIAGVILFRFIVTRKFAQPAWHWFLLRLPLVGPVISHYNLAIISRTMGTLLQSGVTIDAAIATTAETISNVRYQERFRRALEQVSRGARLADALGGVKDSKRNPLFPLLAIKMIGVGERSGQLAESFQYLATYFEREVDTTTKNVTTIIEPALLLIIGLLVAFISLSVISPIYQITGQFGQ